MKDEKTTADELKNRLQAELDTISEALSKGYTYFTKQPYNLIVAGAEQFLDNIKPKGKKDDHKK